MGWDHFMSYQLFWRPYTQTDITKSDDMPLTHNSHNWNSNSHNWNSLLEWAGIWKWGKEWYNQWLSSHLSQSMSACITKIMLVRMLACLSACFFIGCPCEQKMKIVESWEGVSSHVMKRPKEEWNRMELGGRGQHGLEDDQREWVTVLRVSVNGDSRGTNSFIYSTCILSS